MLTDEQIKVIRNVGDLIIDAFCAGEELTDEELQMLWEDEMKNMDDQ